jgi:DNA-binding transcriptional LysR family regulator
MLHARILGYLDEVARSGSVRKAAERLHVSPTAVNKQILQLEAQHGVALFERLPRGMRLTAAGELLVAHVRRTLSDQRQTWRQVERLRGLTGGEIRLATMNGLAAGLLPRIVLRFQQTAPHVRISVTTGFIGGLVKLLDDREIDLCLAYNLPSDPRLQVIDTFDAALGLVVAASHPLATVPVARVQDCLDYPIVIADAFMAMGRNVRDMFARAQAPLHAAHSANSTEYMKALALHGKAVTFLSRFDVDEESRAGTLVWRPLSGQTAPNHLQLVQPRPRPVNPPAEMLAREIAATIHDEFFPV